MDHPDWPAFVGAILANPDDDTVRLVAADFLEENGDPDRAAFIRIQCALARLETAETGEVREVRELRQKERAFLGPLATHHLFWAAEECPELVRMGSARIEGAERLTWRRGFVESVACPAAEWLRHGSAVRKRQPVRTVVLTGCNAVARETWYAGLATLTGLPWVVVETSGGAAFTDWLEEWLPGTLVTDH